MPVLQKSERVPAPCRDRFRRLTRRTDEACLYFLDDEYAQLARYMAAALCRVPVSPLENDKLEKWACGIIYALCQANSRFSRTQEPFITAAQLCNFFDGVSQSEGAAYALKVGKALGIRRFDSNWHVRKRQAASPGAWLIDFEGKILDARTLPHELQVLAYEKGLIPYVPKQDRLWKSSSSQLELL